MKDTIFSAEFFEVIIGIPLVLIFLAFFWRATKGHWGYFFDDLGSSIDKMKGVAKMKTTLKWVSTFLIGYSIHFYTAFVAMCYWNWFVVRVLPMSLTRQAYGITYLEMLGLVWFVGLFTSNDADDMVTEERWKRLGIGITASIPEHKVEQVQEDIQYLDEGQWGKVGAMLFGRAFGLTVSLAMGFVLNSLI